jgi:hypothetical protein
MLAHLRRQALTCSVQLQEIHKTLAIKQSELAAVQMTKRKLEQALSGSAQASISKRSRVQLQGAAAEDQTSFRTPSTDSTGVPKWHLP